jgi:hypothetical protein
MAVILCFIMVGINVAWMINQGCLILPNFIAAILLIFMGIYAYITRV